MVAHSTADDRLEDELDKTMNAYFNALPDDGDKLLNRTLKEIVVTN